MSGSNNNIPAPNNTFQTILTKFKRQGLDIVDLVALSGKFYNLLVLLFLQQPKKRTMKGLLIYVSILVIDFLCRKSHHREFSLHKLQAEALQPIRKWATRLHSSPSLCCTTSKRMPKIWWRSESLFLGLCEPNQI